MCIFAIKAVQKSKNDEITFEDKTICKIEVETGG